MGTRLIHQKPSVKTFADGLLPTIILSTSFVAGSIVGFILAVSSHGNAELFAYLFDYFQTLAGENKLLVNFWPVIWNLTRWPLLAIVLGLSRFGVVAIPLLLFIRGFFLSHAITIVSYLFGDIGILLSLVIFGVIAILAIPALFVVCMDGFCAAVMSPPQKNDVFIFSQKRLAVMLICAGSLAVAAIAQWKLMPFLLEAICADLFVL